ncbi:(Fe-S)-binding protein [Staphylococcus agnetis]|uniref:(Fe-S)-binding protein n=1 Tax=Staphylococcus agnetis TaxID=985762 RepID=UPI001FB4F056|nr:(Fe-S)-binding protein [Staphylococcus agnetis]UOC12842.1 (Fe-S)-binding protein [Staphylococcus agnetis]
MTNLKTQLDYEATFDCVQCGYCLPACPTYVTFKNEKHSPRGRINLVKMAAEEKITLEDMGESIDLCLGCRACETVCPTHVRYGDILSSAVEVFYDVRPKSKVEKMIRYTTFHGLLPHKNRLRLVNKGLRLYQKSGLEKVIKSTNLLKMAPKYAQFQRVMPEVHPSINHWERTFKCESTVTVGFFQGCMMDAFFSHINQLALRIMAAQGLQVTNIPSQTCCGALQHHAGQTLSTIQLAKQNIEAYEQYDFDYIVNTIGGCGAALKEYDTLFEEGTLWHDRAKAFVNKVRDISEILNDYPLPVRHTLNYEAVYQPSCHLENVQRVVQEPESLLTKLPGLTLHDFPNQHHCCGSAGIYNLVHYDAAMQILDEKMKHVKTQQPNLIITSNPGCHLQMKLGVEREGLSDQIDVKHVVEVVAEACRITL